MVANSSAICKNRNGKSKNGMRGIVGIRRIRMGTQGIKEGMRGIRVGMRRMGLGMWGIRVILCENIRVYCFG